MEIILTDWYMAHTTGLTVISGGNLGTKWKPSGADRMWAKAAANLHIPYEIWVPKGYGEHYYSHSGDMMKRFNNMCKGASKVVYAPPTEPFHWQNNFVRNEMMVGTGTDFFSCSSIEPRLLLKKSNGGTADAVKEMAKNGISSVHWIRSTDGADMGEMPL